MLYIENTEGINSVEVYDATGKVIISDTYDSNLAQIQLPLIIKGVVMIKVNSEVVKVAI